MSASPFDRTPAAARIYTQAQLPRNLMGGVESMRLASFQGAQIATSGMGTTIAWSYLPRWPLETVDAWAARVNSTFLEPYYPTAASAVAGKAFAEGVTLGEDVAPAIAGEYDEDGNTITPGLWENIDFAGMHGEVFSQWVFSDSLHTGIGHILVEYPRAEGIATIADELAAGVRPYWVYVPGDAVTGWKWETQNGRQRLTQFRYLETVCVPDGAFGEKTIERVRVYYASDAEYPYARFEVYEKGKESDALALDAAGNPIAGLLKPQTEIPLATFIPGVSKKWEDARPFLHDLAWVNLEAWQSGSDQRNSLHFARVPFYAFFGFDDEAMKKFTGVGAAARAHTNNADARIDVIEGSGAGMGEGWKDLDRLRAAADALSSRPFNPSIQVKTATQVNAEQGATLSPVALAVRNMKDCIELALGYTAIWLGLSKEEGGSVKMVEDMTGPQTGTDKARVILDARGTTPPLISAKTARKELAATGAFSDDFNPEEEEDLLALEGVGGKGFDASAEPDFMVDGEEGDVTPPEPGAQPEPVDAGTQDEPTA